MLWTGPGYNRLPPYTGIEFNVDNIPNSKYYDIVVRYDPETSGPYNKAQLMVKRPYGIDNNGPCYNYSTSNDIRTVNLPYNDRKAVVDSICFDKGHRYQIELNTNEFDAPAHDPNKSGQSVLIDSVCIFILIIYSFI